MIDVSGVRSSCETSAKNSFLRRSVSASTRRRSSTSATSVGDVLERLHRARAPSGPERRWRNSNMPSVSLERHEEAPGAARRAARPRAAFDRRLGSHRHATSPPRAGLRVRHPVDRDGPAQRAADRLQHARDDVLVAGRLGQRLADGRAAPRARARERRARRCRATNALICQPSPVRSGETETSTCSRRPSRCSGGELEAPRVVAPLGEQLEVLGAVAGAPALGDQQLVDALAQRLVLARSRTGPRAWGVQASDAQVAVDRDVGVVGGLEHGARVLRLVARGFQRERVGERDGGRVGHQPQRLQVVEAALARRRERDQADRPAGVHQRRRVVQSCTELAWPCRR